MDNSSNSKRIARNTLFLYMRMFFTMVIALYTSRVILDVLGVEDYGIYNVVGSLASSFIFLSSTLSNATQRYLNYEIGSRNNTRLCLVFNMSILIYLVFALVSLLIIEIGGHWMIYNKLSIPESRVNAALWVLHSTSITLFITLISTVYESVLIARENMKVYAYIGIYDALMKLVIVFLISTLSYDRLKLYAVFITLVVVTERLIPVCFTIRKYDETKLKCVWNKKTFTEMFRFIGWDFLGTSVFILNDQGINILLNMFFGPVVNAARALSVNVKQAVANFSSGFFTAVRPQIVKSYASGDINYFTTLLYNSSKYSFYLLWMICLPVMIRIDSLLSLWLKEVPSQTGSFVIWILIFNLINSLCDPFWQGMQAVGKLKKYIIIGSSVYLLAFPLSWIAFKIGYDAIITFKILVFVRLFYLWITIVIFKQYVTLNLVTYCKEVIAPIIVVVIISSIITIYIDSLFFDTLISTVISCGIAFTSAILCIVVFGVNKKERTHMFNVIKKKYANYKKDL